MKTILILLGVCSRVLAVQAPVDYKPTVPHSSHITMMLSDYRYHQIPTEYTWTTNHYDHVMSGDIQQYRKRAPSMKYYSYALNLTIIRETPGDKPDLAMTYYRDMQKWYAANTKYQLEDAFLHDASICPGSRPKTETCRVQTSWGQHTHWVVHPGDPGLRAYDADRIQRITTKVGGTAHSADGIFFDQHSSGDFNYWKTFSIREYPVWSRYENDVVDLLVFERKSLGKIILINTSELIGPMEQRMVLAAGGAHMELLNNPFSNEMRERWSFIDVLLKQGAFVEMVNAYTWNGISRKPGFTPGSQMTRPMRLKMGELCSYYMVVPIPATNLAVDMVNDGWNDNYSWQWLRAIEADVGTPTGPRAIAYQGLDSLGKQILIWRREFDKAVVFMHYQKPWDYENYGDSTAFSLPLPSGETWYPLKGDGTLADPVTSVNIRNVEGVILFKGSALPPSPQ